MSQTDSLKEPLTLAQDPQFLSAALRLALPAAELEEALRQIERLTPMSARICLHLLQRLSIESESWKAAHLARLLYLGVHLALGTGQSSEVAALDQALQQAYPELFGLEY